MSLVAEARTIDARQIAPQERHATIFAAFGSLAAGESFDLLSDHEPRPLHGQFLQQWPGQFSWDVVEAGPAHWRTRIRRLAAGKSCCGSCGG
ncbi:MAG: DUF2249 domain-containing protein [Rubrivivax sp.]|nr:DUF2249 domain-containing protein [Rubrivivax sp.]